MKLRQHEMQPMLDSVNNATDIVRDDNGLIQSFNFIRYYGTSKRNGKKIHVSLKSDKEASKVAAAYLDEKEFYHKIIQNIIRIEDVKLHCDKIYKYTLDGVKYKTDKTETKKLFDFLPYADFKKVTNQRFWNDDGMLRNGYFSGLIGTFNQGIREYQKNIDSYTLYDVDFNAAYPYCFKMPLPTGRFYTLQEWEKVKDNFVSSMKFYQIKIKNISNPFKIFVPPAPYVEYADFDFLMQKNNSNMIVSQQRLSLIRQVYGNDSFVIKREYICATKIYLKFADFSQKLYDDIQKAKKENNQVLAAELKIALNSLVGNFGRRDEQKRIKGLKLVKNGIVKDVIAVQWTAPEKKIKPNYLPLAMVINDITARRLFDMMCDENVIRLCYNTDGGIIALKKGCRIVTSERIGRLKAQPILKPEFYYTTMLYNRPLIYDAFTKKTYNTKSIEFDEKSNRFLYTETARLNTGNGFITYENTFPIVVETYQYFNFRREEILIRLSNHPLHKKMLSATKDPIKREMIKDAIESFEKICNPYDVDLNEIRHKPQVPEHIDYEQQTMFTEKFFKQM